MKLILFEKSRVELEFVFSIFTTKSPETLWELRSIEASHFHFNLQKIAKYFRTRSPVSAADVDGWRARELMAPLFMGDDEELQALIQAHLILPYLFGDFHPSHIQEYAGGLLFALEKPAKDGGGILPRTARRSARDDHLLLIYTTSGAALSPSTTKTRAP